MKQAISATVTGQDQGVGFRAMVMKQAIRFNLAGSAENEPNGIVKFTLQGDDHGIDKAVATIRGGTAKSSNIQVATNAAPVAPDLATFTVVGWTSLTRQITNPYNLVFTLRPDDSELSKDDAKTAWHQILRNTLQGADLAKLGPDD